MGRPIHFRIVLVGLQQRAVGAVQHIGKAVAVEVDQGLGGLSVHVGVGQDHFVDPVIVPLVVRRHLIHPLRDTGVGVAGEHGH